MANLFGSSISGQELKEKINSLIINKHEDGQMLPYNLSIKNSLEMNYLFIEKNFFVNNSLIVVPKCLLKNFSEIYLNNKNIIDNNGVLKNINELNMKDTYIVSDGIEYRDKNSNTKYMLVEGNIRLGYKINNYKYNFKHIGYGNIINPDVQNSNVLVLNSYDNYGMVDFFVKAPYDKKGKEQGVENSLSFWWSKDNRFYSIYGDHNNVFHAGEINILQPNEGRQIIGSHAGTKKDNAIYLRSINKEFNNGDKDYTTLTIRSPKNTDGTEVTLEERLKLQTSGPYEYKLYGEHNYKEVVVHIFDGDTSSQKYVYTFEELGINFIPKKIIGNGYELLIKDETFYQMFLFNWYDEPNRRVIQAVTFNNTSKKWEIIFNSSNYHSWVYLQFYA